jgi:cysteinyl-tRNA synthetase
MAAAVLRCCTGRGVVRGELAAFPEFGQRGSAEMADDVVAYAPAKRAFDRAVRREFEAIRLHEAAASRHWAAATVLEQRAARDSNHAKREMSLRLAERCRARAAAALNRAQEARNRLRDEGIEPT